MTDQESVEDRNMHIRLSLVGRQGPANISFRPADRPSQTDAHYMVAQTSNVGKQPGKNSVCEFEATCYR